MLYVVKYELYVHLMFYKIDLINDYWRKFKQTINLKANLIGKMFLFPTDWLMRIKYLKFLIQLQQQFTYRATFLSVKAALLRHNAVQIMQVEKLLTYNKNISFIIYDMHNFETRIPHFKINKCYIYVIKRMWNNLIKYLLRQMLQF